MQPSYEYLVTQIDKIDEQDMYTNYIHLLCITSYYKWTHTICKHMLKCYTKVGTIDAIK